MVFANYGRVVIIDHPFFTAYVKALIQTRIEIDKNKHLSNTARDVAKKKKKRKQLGHG